MDEVKDVNIEPTVPPLPDLGAELETEDAWRIRRIQELNQAIRWALDNNKYCPSKRLDERNLHIEWLQLFRAGRV